MARRTPLTSLHQINEINLTPLMDLTFILLITFIITFPMIEQGIIVNLPVGAASEIKETQVRTITIDDKALLYLDDDPLTLEDLRAEMQILGETKPDTTVLVRADEALAYGRVMDILKILHEFKLSRMSLVTRAE